MKPILNLVFSIMAVSSLVGCSPRGVSTFDELTISASNDGEYARPANFKYPLQSRFLAVNGQLPVPSPGSSCLASSFRVANSIICFSPPGRSTHVRVREYPSTNATLGQMTAIKDSLTNLQVTLAKLVQLETNAIANPASDEEKQQQQLKIETTAETVVQKVEAIRVTAAQQNIFIFRWGASDKKNSNAALGGIFSARGAAERSESGLVIVGGLTASQLMIGLGDFDDNFGQMPSAAKIATLTMSADHLMYFTNAGLSAALEAEYSSDLADLKKKLDPQTKLALRAYAQIGSAQENQGLFSAPVNREKSLAEAYDDLQEKQIFYATMTDVKTLRKAIQIK